MNRQGLRRTLEKYGDFLNVTQVAKYLGVSRDTARMNFLNDLSYIKNGNEKLYFKEDVLDSLMDKLTCN